MDFSYAEVQPDEEFRDFINVLGLKRDDGGDGWCAQEKQTREARLQNRTVFPKRKIKVTTNLADAFRCSRYSVVYDGVRGLTCKWRHYKCTVDLDGLTQVVFLTSSD
jgi:hypothetical protein